jgi:hypothetical protein
LRQADFAGAFSMAWTSWAFDIVARPSMSSAAARRNSSFLDRCSSRATAVALAAGRRADRPRGDRLRDDPARDDRDRALADARPSPAVWDAT